MFHNIISHVTHYPLIIGWNVSSIYITATSDFGQWNSFGLRAHCSVYSSILKSHHLIFLFWNNHDQTGKQQQRQNSKKCPEFSLLISIPTWKYNLIGALRRLVCAHLLAVTRRSITNSFNMHIPQERHTRKVHITLIVFPIVTYH